MWKALQTVAMSNKAIYTSESVVCGWVGVVMLVIPAIWPENSQKVKPYQWTDRQING